MSSFGSFSDFFTVVAKAIEINRVIEMDKLMSEVEAFNIANAIDISLATGNREAFNKLVGSE
ncbi:hypothetical protein ACIQ6U_09705 [Lysinibacillus fusiformis]|uniref:hypothetical protein n=1 Tax=Lysinibacillus fusiformis TaxID=28031 RepID=UPI003802FF14